MFNPNPCIDSTHGKCLATRCYDPFASITRSTPECMHLYMRDTNFMVVLAVSRRFTTRNPTTTTTMFGRARSHHCTHRVVIVYTSKSHSNALFFRSKPIRYKQWRAACQDLWGLHIWSIFGRRPKGDCIQRWICYRVIVNVGSWWCVCVCSE